MNTPTLPGFLRFPQEETFVSNPEDGSSDYDVHTILPGNYPISYSDPSESGPAVVAVQSILLERHRNIFALPGREVHHQVHLHEPVTLTLRAQPLQLLFSDTWEGGELVRGAGV